MVASPLEGRAKNSGATNRTAIILQTKSCNVKQKHSEVET